jgi:hypothetical protein
VKVDSHSVIQTPQPPQLNDWTPRFHSVSTPGITWPSLPHPIFMRPLYPLHYHPETVFDPRLHHTLPLRHLNNALSSPYWSPGAFSCPALAPPFPFLSRNPHPNSFFCPSFPVMRVQICVPQSHQSYSPERPQLSLLPSVVTPASPVHTVSKDLPRAPEGQFKADVAELDPDFHSSLPNPLSVKKKPLCRSINLSATFPKLPSLNLEDPGRVKSAFLKLMTESCNLSRSTFRRDLRPSDSTSPSEPLSTRFVFPIPPPVSPARVDGLPPYCKQLEKFWLGPTPSPPQVFRRRKIMKAGAHFVQFDELNLSRRTLGKRSHRF